MLAAAPWDIHRRDAYREYPMAGPRELRTRTLVLPTPCRLWLGQKLVNHPYRACRACHQSATRPARLAHRRPCTRTSASQGHQGFQLSPATVLKSSQPPHPSPQPQKLETPPPEYSRERKHAPSRSAGAERSMPAVEDRNVAVEAEGSARTHWAALDQILP